MPLNAIGDLKASGGGGGLMTCHLFFSRSSRF
jgi:hypothetical protein